MTGRNDFFTCEKLVSRLLLVEVKSETLFHTAKFDAKISVYDKIRDVLQFPNLTNADQEELLFH